MKKKTMKQPIIIFGLVPSKTFSLINLAMCKNKFWCVLSFVSFFHFQLKAMTVNAPRIGQLLSHFRRNTC